MSILKSISDLNLNIKLMVEKLELSIKKKDSRTVDRIL
jgi:hypothetical protein